MTIVEHPVLMAAAGEHAAAMMLPMSWPLISTPVLQMAYDSSFSSCLKCILHKALSLP